MLLPRRVASLVLVTAGLAAACANGDEPSTADASVTATPGDAGPDACAACAPGFVCSQGACVSINTDADNDGITVDKDCDDKDPQVHPGAAEVCNGKDDNCDGKIDEGFDKDGDGYASCASNGKGADCDDADPKINPGAAEVCNNKDDNCNGTTDEGFDKDNDGFYACARGTTPADCDDNDPKIKPGGTEICNGKDDDCNGKTDEIPAVLDSNDTTGKASLVAPVSSRWAIAYNAAFGGPLGRTGWVRLNDDVGGVGGALWFNASYLFDTFDMTATIWIQNNPGGADGMAFGWIKGNDVTAIGNPGGGYGMQGIAGGGYAVAIDTYLNPPNDVSVPFLTLINTADGFRIATAALPAAVRNSNDHTLRVKLDAGKVSAWVDGTNYFNDVPIPGYVAFSGHWGFTGATGGASEAHWVSNVKMQFPNGQGCVVPP